MRAAADMRKCHFRTTGKVKQPPKIRAEPFLELQQGSLPNLLPPTRFKDFTFMCPFRKGGG